MGGLCNSTLDLAGVAGDPSSRVHRLAPRAIDGTAPHRGHRGSRDLKADRRERRAVAEHHARVTDALDTEAAKELRQRLGIAWDRHAPVLRR